MSDNNENVIEFLRNQQTATVCFCQPSYVSRVKELAEGFYAEGHSEHAYRCSECGEHYIGYVGEFKYCPNCGADMRGET